MAQSTIFQSCQAISQRKGERKERKKRVEEKNEKNAPHPAPAASTTGPCPTEAKVVGCPGTESNTAPSHHPTSHFC